MSLEHKIRMIPADGEHGAAGICYGATSGGGRVFNATASQGFLYSLEQLPVQSSSRFPMRAMSSSSSTSNTCSPPRARANSSPSLFLSASPE